MPSKILMPALSPTMTEGKLAKWLVKEGDDVSAGDPIAEIETDKATMEVEAVDAGKLAKIVVPAGTENVAVNTLIAVLLEEGEDPSALAGALKDAQPGGATKPAQAAPAPKPAAQPASPAQPAAKAEPEAAPKPAPPPQPAAAPKRSDADDRVFASPLARRLATQAGLDISRIGGSGPHGRIVKSDVEAAQASGGAAAQRPSAAQQPAQPTAVTLPPVAPGAAVQLPALLETGEFEAVPLSTMRKVIAQRLQESKQTIPHFYITLDVELDSLLALRKQLNDRREDVKITVNDLLIRACGMALQQVPECNVIWTGNQMFRSKSYDVAVAVAIDGGLITPVIMHADRKGLGVISAEMKDKAERARKGKLLPEEYQGGCFSLSNLGMFGIKFFQAIINPPQCSILAVGVGEQRPVVKDGALTTATIMSATLSCDHRAIDGALGAKWLNAFKRLVEDPLTMML
jgi:pyruvate dehydrogenase E2 component (dihydrolipoamide acetyltransferase)